MDTKKSVLIVDDEPGLREVLSDRFTAAGWETTLAADGREALEKVRTGAFNLVLLDITMPKMTGLEFLESIKDDPARKTLAVVILTVSASGDDIKKALTLGARDYFVKSHDSIEKIIRWADEYTNAS